jgi:hypothetical protein
MEPKGTRKETAMQQQLVWAAVIVGAITLFCLPVIIAAIRGTDPIWPVALLTVLTPLGGVTWFAAWIAAFAFPRRRPAPPRRLAPPRQLGLPPQEDPRYLYGGVLPADTAVVSRHPAGGGSGVSAWS